MIGKYRGKASRSPQVAFKPLEAGVGRDAAEKAPWWPYGVLVLVCTAAAFVQVVFGS